MKNLLVILMLLITSIAWGFDIPEGLRLSPEKSLFAPVISDKIWTAYFPDKESAEVRLVELRKSNKIDRIETKKNVGGDVTIKYTYKE